MGMMERADSNGDKMINRAEYTAAMQERFARSDSNNDGILSKDEIRGLRDQRPERRRRM